MNSQFLAGLASQEPASQRQTFLSIVTETFVPDINGVAHTMGHVVRGLQASGQYRLQLVRPRNEPAPEGAIPDEVEEHFVGSLRLPFYQEIRLGYPQYFTLKKLWTQERPDMVQVVTEGPLGFAAVKAARALNIPVISDFHTNFDQYAKSYHASGLFKLASWYLKYLHNQTLITLVPTRELQKQLEGKGYVSTGIMERGIETQLFNPARRNLALREKLGVQPHELLVVLVSRIAQEKNLDLAFDAFYEIEREVPDAKFLIVGDGPEKQRLERDYDDCIFVGRKVGVELAEHYASSDLFLYPSTSETFGNVVLEAMMSGVPTVAFGYAAAGQFIQTGQNGVTVPLDDNDAFIKASVKLAKDHQGRQRMAINAHQSVEHLSWDRVVDRLHQTIQNILYEVGHETYSPA